MVTFERNQGNFSNDPNYALRLYDDQDMKMVNYAEWNPVNIRVSVHADPDIIYPVDSASTVVERGTGIQMKDFRFFRGPVNTPK